MIVTAPARPGRAAAAVLLAAALLLPAPTLGQARITTTVDTTRITVGDRVGLEIAVEHDTDAVVVWPDTVDAGPFEVLTGQVLPTRTSGGRATSRARFALTAFELGDVEIPPFEVRVLRGDGSEETLRTDGYGIEVVSVGIDETGDIREIRGPLSIPIGILRVSAWLVVLALLTLGGWALWRRLRRAKTHETSHRPGPPPRPAHEIALEELARLEASGLIEQGAIKDYHIRASEIVRRYVEARFGVPALEMTTWEVLGGLQAMEVAEDVRTDLRRFLDPCDAVKFAKVRPTPEASRTVLDLGRTFVQRSMPRVAVDPGTPGSAVRGEEAPGAGVRRGEASSGAESQDSPFEAEPASPGAP